MNIEIVVIPVALLLVAFLYSSVGHGGASGYIAVLSLFNVAVSVYKPVVLVPNIIIAGIAFYQFHRAGYFKWNLCWPFLISSIPCAFLGSTFKLHDNTHNLLLGLALIFPILRLAGIPKTANRDDQIKLLPLASALFFGALIGFLSGMLNIGGGIFLSPILILFAWSTAKEAAAVSSLFIVCNSAAGLLGAQTLNAVVFTSTAYLWIVAAVIGGIGGSYLGSHKYAQLTIRYLLAAVLAIASIKLIFFAK